MRHYHDIVSDMKLMLSIMSKTKHLSEMAVYLLDMLSTRIEYRSADPYNTYTMYNPVDIHWDVLNDIMTLYYSRYYRIFRLNGLPYMARTECIQLHPAMIHMNMNCTVCFHPHPPHQTSVATVMTNALKKINIAWEIKCQ